MKANKLFRKLALSGVALGAAAVTLTATTFAWYTSNTEADVTAVSGQTEAKGADSLFISTAHSYNGAEDGVTVATWNDYLATADPTMTGGSSITLKPVYSNYGTAKIVNAVTGDTPVEAVEGRSYNEIDKVTGDNKDVVSYKTEATSNFMEFVFRIRSSSALAADLPLYFSKFNITTAAQTGATITQIPLAVGADTVGIINNSAYGADLMKALKLDITTAEVTLGEGNTIPQNGTTTRLAGQSGEANQVTTLGFEALGGSDTNIKADGANAIAYYNTVMGTHIAAPTGQNADYNVGVETTKTAAANKQLSFATLPKTTGTNPFSVLEVRFVLYLDGWDNYCYDIMQGQKVDFSFEITSTKDSAVLYTVA